METLSDKMIFGIGEGALPVKAVKKFIRELKGELRGLILNEDGKCMLDYYEVLELFDKLAGDKLI